MGKRERQASDGGIAGDRQVVENHALIFFIRSYHSRTMRAS